MRVLLRGRYHVPPICPSSLLREVFTRMREHGLTEVPRVRLRSGPILTTNKPRTDREASDLPDMEKNYKKFLVNFGVSRRLPVKEQPNNSTQQSMGFPD